MLPVSAFLHERLNTTFRPNRLLEVTIVESPSLELDHDHCVRLVEECRTIALACIPDGSLDYGIFGSDPTALERSVVTVVRDRSSGKAIAFNVLPLLAVDLGGVRQQVLHLGLVMVDPSHRGGGLSWILYGLTCILLFARRQFRPVWISSVTQVPAVVGMVSETFDQVWPAQAETVRSFAHVHLARQIMMDHRHAFGVSEDAVYDDARSIIQDAYRGGSDALKKRFEDATAHREPRYGEFCYTELDYGRGDDVLQIGQLNFATVRRFSIQSVPGGSVVRLAVQFAFIAMRSLVAPVFQWMASDRRLGRLREA